MVRKHQFSTDEFDRMGDSRVFPDGDERLELLAGEVLVMAPIGPRHAYCVDRLDAAFSALRPQVLVRVQGPLRLDENSEPMPDIMLIRPPFGVYESRHPVPRDVLLLVEVADTTQSYDRGRKLPRYAAGGVRECWLVDLAADRIEVYRDPVDGAYLSRRAAGRGESVGPAAFPGFTLFVDEVL